LLALRADDLQRYGRKSLPPLPSDIVGVFAERKAGAPKISFEPGRRRAPCAVLESSMTTCSFCSILVVGELHHAGSTSVFWSLCVHGRAQRGGTLIGLS